MSGSKGNSNTDGNKKNNFPWQVSMLMILGSIDSRIAALIPVAGVVETVTSTTETASGTIAAGAKVVTFETSEDFVGSILTTTRQPSRAYTFRANGEDTLSAIVYVITSGSMNIDKQI